jgi:hypothetical protein
LPNDRQAESRTLIDMSLSVRSLDLDFATGTFKLSGWMKLAWRDDRQMPPPSQRKIIPLCRLWTIIN